MKKKYKKKSQPSFSQSVIFGLIVVLLGIIGLSLSWSRLVAQIENNSVEAADISPIGQTGQWQLVFNDEFDGSSLNTNIWEPSWFNGNNISKPINDLEDGCYDPQNVSISNGKLVLSAKNTSDPKCVKKDGSRADYSSGLVSTYDSYSFNEGYIEARIYLPGSNGDLWNWPAFWTNGKGDWPQTGELDIMEGLSGHKPCWHYHYELNGKHQDIGDCVEWSDAPGWHTYGMKRESDKVTFYYDGEQVGQITEHIVTAPHYIILNYAINDAYGINVPSAVEVDYVRVWEEDTSTPSATPVATATPTNVPTKTPTPTKAPTTVPTQYNSPTPTQKPTNTPVPSVTPTPVSTESGVTVSSLTLYPASDIQSTTNVRARVTVSSATPIKVEALTVAVRDTRNKNYDFRGARTNVTIDQSGFSFTTDARTFSEGEYVAFVAYKHNNKWYNLSPQVHFESESAPAPNRWLLERWRRWRR